MSRLLIDAISDELQKEASETQSETTNTEEIEKQAEEEAMQKIAEEINVLDQSRTLIAIGEEMYKVAEELQDEVLAVLAVDTYQAGERMGACLSKTASEYGAALIEALELAEDMNKLAHIYADLADEVGEETLSKMAEAVIAISNEMTEDANELYKLASEEEAASEEVASEETASEEVEKEAEEKKDGYKAKGIWKGTGVGAGAGAAAGAGIAAAIAHKLGLTKGQAAGLGAIIGANAGAGIGNVSARIKQTSDHNKALGHKHNILRAFTPTAQGEMNRATSTKDQLKTLNVGGAVAGGWGRFLHKKEK